MRRGTIFWVLIKTAIFTALVPYTAGFWLPAEISQRRGAALSPPGAGAFWEGLLSDFLLCAGVAIYLWCAWDFSVQGLGTPAPLDAPKKLVVKGLYRFARNPMYIGVFCVIVSRAILFRSLPVLLYLVLFMAGAHLFVRFYEEPRLRSVFGAQYGDYSRRVPRWLPRFRAAQVKS
jgi:protein-S-isoprenylcysteine O-methyltransferase Ste14